MAIVAAVVFGLALILDLAGASLGPIGTGTLVTLGLLLIALHLAGIGAARRSFNWRRARR